VKSPGSGKAGITIVIPTHERHNYLARIIEYYQDSNINVIVADSSETPFRKLIKNDRLIYLHLPGVNIMTRILLALDAVETPYVVFCADDDFIAKTSLSECIAFLAENTDYESVQGYILSFVNFHGRLNLRLMYRHVCNMDISEYSPEERLKRYYRNFVQTFYTVRRTEGLKEIISEIHNSEIEEKLIDQAMGMFSMIKGKLKVLPVFFGAREFVARSGSQSLVSLEDLFLKKEFASRMQKFYSACASYLTRNSALSGDISEKVILNTYAAWMGQRRNNNTALSVFFCRLKKKVNSALFHFNLDKVSITFGIVYDGANGDLHLENQIQNEDLNNIKNLIKKHNINSL
jgi:glycosyltransferase domain-containing protein